MKINFDRIKYSPLGKKIIKNFKVEILLGVCTVPLASLLCVFFSFVEGAEWSGVILTAVLIGIPVCFVIGTVRSTLFEAELLSAMTDEEHNKLIAEYKEFEERNIIRYGHLTSYGMILGDRILPWKNVKKIRFIPGEYRRRVRGGYQYHPAKISVLALFGKKQVVSTYIIANEDYDLSDEIESFLKSISKYTEYQFAVENGYYFAK